MQARSWTRLSPIFFVAPFVLFAASAEAQNAPANRYDSLFDQVMALPGSVAAGGEIKGVTIQRDSALSFVLETGRLYVLGPVAGRTIGAVFIGQGRVHFTPPTEFEREQLKRSLRSDSLNRSFSSLFLLFDDTAGLGFGKMTPGGQAATATADPAGVARKALGYLSNKGRRYFDPHFMTALLNNERDDFLYAVAGEVEGGPLVLRLDPYEVEELSLSVPKPGPALTDDRTVMVTSTHRSHDYAGGKRPPHDRKERFSINRYTIDASISGSYKFKSSARIATDWMAAPAEWFSLWLYSDLKVDSASWADGQRAVFARGKDSPILWIQRPGAARATGMPDLVVHYHGDLIEANGLWTELKTSNGWYPSVDQGYGAPVTAIYDLTFHTPRGQAFASVGDRTAIDSAGDVVTSHWVTRMPAAHASFNIGKFDTFAVKDVRDLPVTVFVNQEAHNRLGAVGYRDEGGRLHGGVIQKNMKETVGQDVALSLNFFRNAFGEPVADQFYATEIFGWHGQAFPGLIHFSFITYQGFMLDKGEDEAFRAHEMAHQWWGLGVVPQSYRDAWMSEGFAEFASWWYTQAILRDSVALNKMLKKSKESLMVRRKQAGPLWLGTRLADGEMPEDYSLVIYQRGAWVLRMLYYMLLDPDTGEQAFRRMMKDFYDTYRGMDASTGDFQDMVSRHFRQPMDWFFNSWVYGTGIPTYEWSHATEETAGKFTWRLHVAQSNVDDDFTMVVPVHFYFADGRDGTAGVKVSGPVTDFSVELPAKPARVVFNENDAVLAEVKEAKWR